MSTLEPFAIELESGAVVGPLTELQVQAFFDEHADMHLRLLSGADAEALIAKANGATP